MKKKPSIKTPLDVGPMSEEEPTHSEDGVDLTLIRWMLSLTPTQRLEVLQCNILSIMRLRGDDAET